MLTPIQKALRVQRKATKKVDGRNAIVCRGSLAARVKLTIGESTREEIVENDLTTEIILRDFFIDRPEYDFGFGPVEPEAGDIVRTNGESWQVLPTDSESQSRRHDRDGLTWRIHTKEIHS